MRQQKRASKAQANLNANLQALHFHHLKPEADNGSEWSVDNDVPNSLKRLAEWIPSPPVEFPAITLKELDPDELFGPATSRKVAKLLGYGYPHCVAEAVGLSGRTLGTEHDLAARAWASALTDEQFTMLAQLFWLRIDDAFDTDFVCCDGDAIKYSMLDNLVSLFWVLEASGRDVEVHRYALMSVESRFAGQR